MRNIIAAAAASIALTSALSVSVSAQRAPVRFGVLAGANLSSVNDVQDGFAGAGEELLTQKKRAGGQAAFYAVVPVKGALSLQPEVHYVQKGGKAELSLPIDPEELAQYASDRMTIGLELSYLEIPLLARLDLGSSRWRPFLIAGPSFSLRTGCSVRASFGELSLSGSCSEEVPSAGDATPTEPSQSVDPVKKTDIGAIGGVGLQGAMMGRMFSVQLRYTQGLRSIASDDVVSVSPKNRSLALVLGLGF